MIRSIDEALRTSSVFLVCLALSLPLDAQSIRGVVSSSAPSCKAPGGYAAQAGRYRGHGVYRRPPASQVQRPVSIPQPGSLLPGSYGLDAAYGHAPRSRKFSHRSNGYGIPSTYVVYVPSSAAQVDDRSRYATQEIYDAAPPPQTVYVMVQPPATPPAEPQPTPRTVSPPPVVAPAPPSPPRSREPSEVQLRVQPLDALVHLDGRLLGTAEDLAAVDHTVVLSPGVYVLEVTHAELRSQRLVFAAQSGLPALVEIDLQADRGSRRARLTTPEDLPLKLGSGR